VPFVCPECAKVEAAPGFCTEHGVSLADSASDPLLGQLVGSHRIARLIGRGGMGEVYLGVHPTIGSRVAVKLLAFEAALSPAMLDRFFAEARAVNVIRHEGIVNVLDLSRLPDGRPYITMEYIDGAPLSSVLERYRPVPLGGFAELMASVVDALGAAHAQGITHRDLKPDNVFVTSMGRTKILDFGIAKLRPDIAEISAQTRTGALMGTPFYMSPEQARGLPADHRSDLYAIGVILYEGMTGRRPFEGASLYELLRQQIEVAPQRPSLSRSDIPPALESVVLRALEKDPALRFQSAAELSAALREAARFLPPESFVTLAGQPGQRALPIVSPRVALAPTTPGYAQTVSGAHAMPKARNLTPIWIGVGALVLVALLAATAAGTLLLFGDRDTITVVETPPPPAAGAETSELETSEPESTDTAENVQIDPVKLHTRSLALAQQSFSDATLQSILVESPKDDGTIDFDAGGAIVMTYVSPSAAKAGPAGKCAVWITHHGGAELTATVPPLASCMGGSVRPPRCPLSAVVKKLKAHGSDVTLQYAAPGTWSVIGEDLFGKSTPDDCGARPPPASAAQSEPMH
jgi:serine/threonine-protein kinase